MKERTRYKESTSLHALHAVLITIVAIAFNLFVSSASAGGHSLGNIYSAFNVEGMMKVLPKPNPLKPSEAARSCTRTSFSFASPDAERAFMKEKNGSTSDYRFWSRQWGEYWFKDRAYSFDGRQECWDQQLIASKMQEALGDQPTGALTFSQVSQFAAAVDKELQRRKIASASVPQDSPSTSGIKDRGREIGRQPHEPATMPYRSRDGIAGYREDAPFDPGVTPERAAAIMDEIGEMQRDKIYQDQAREEEARRQQAADENLRQQHEYSRRLQQEEDARRMQQQY